MCTSVYILKSLNRPILRDTHIYRGTTHTHTLTRERGREQCVSSLTRERERKQCVSCLCVSEISLSLSLLSLLSLSLCLCLLSPLSLSLLCYLISIISTATRQHLQQRVEVPLKIHKLSFGCFGPRQSGC
jgi:hypothetical protein